MKTLRILLIAISLISLKLVKAQNVGEAAPDFSLSQLDGGSFTLSDHLGKVVFIFTFGNSCSHCIANGPSTESIIYQEFKDDPRFVAVGIDAWDGNSAKLSSFRASTGITYPLLMNGSTVVSTYESNYDRLIVIDPDGLIQYKSNNNATQAVCGDAKVVIQSLLQSANISRPQAAQSLELINQSDKLLINNPFGEETWVNYRIIDMAGRLLKQEQVYLSSQIPFS